MATEQDIVDQLVKKTEKRELAWRRLERDLWEAGWVNDCLFRIDSSGSLQVRLQSAASRLTIASTLTSELIKTVERVYSEDEPSEDEKLKRILACLDD